VDGVRALELGPGVAAVKTTPGDEGRSGREPNASCSVPVQVVSCERSTARYPVEHTSFVSGRHPLDPYNGVLKSGEI
jgi:hypothetical protein